MFQVLPMYVAPLPAADAQVPTFQPFLRKIYSLVTDIATTPINLVCDFLRKFMYQDLPAHPGCGSW
jgi:hypothetical protein